jgi:hypothetical protein
LRFIRYSLIEVDVWPVNTVLHVVASEFTAGMQNFLTDGAPAITTHVLKKENGEGITREEKKKREPVPTACIKITETDSPLKT